MLCSPAFEPGGLMARKRGRPAKAGARYPSGKLKPAIEPIAPALWQRIASEAKIHAIDERMGSQLGRLFMHGEFTTKQIAAGFRVAETYGTFERLKAKRRSVMSPSYGGRGDHSIAEELMDAQTLEDLEANIRTAEDKFKALQKWFHDNPDAARFHNAIEELCVEDRAVSSLILPDLRNVFDRLGFFFGFTTARHALKQPGAIAKKPTLRQDAQVAPRQPNIDRIYWIEVVRRLRPDLSDDQLNEAYEVQRALVARAVFRRSKQKRADNVIDLAARR